MALSRTRFLWVRAISDGSRDSEIAPTGMGRDLESAPTVELNDPVFGWEIFLHLLPLYAKIGMSLKGGRKASVRSFKMGTN